MTKEFDERNMAKSRRVCEAMAEAASTSKRVLSEREKLILDRWPKFEDGECVWFGDAYIDTDGDANKVRAIEFDDGCTDLVGIEGFHTGFFAGERAKRPAPEVLDAEVVEIKVGDSMYVANNGDGPYIVCDIDENIDRIELFWHENRNEKLFIAANRLTHTRPDSWERLEEDAEFNDETGIVGGNLDIVRRAKALAGMEVGR